MINLTHQKNYLTNSNHQKSHRLNKRNQHADEEYYTNNTRGTINK